MNSSDMWRHIVWQVAASYASVGMASLLVDLSVDSEVVNTVRYFSPVLYSTVVILCASEYGYRQRRLLGGRGNLLRMWEVAGSNLVLDACPDSFLVFSEESVGIKHQVRPQGLPSASLLIRYSVTHHSTLSNTNVSKYLYICSKLVKNWEGPGHGRARLVRDTRKTS
jgi:hypothetical protein